MSSTSLAFDKEVFSSCFEGRVPVLFHFQDSTEPVFHLIPRNTYLSLYVEPLLQRLASPAEDGTVPVLERQHVHFEHNGTQLPLGWPVGVLFDLLCRPFPGDAGLNVGASVPNFKLPFLVTVLYDTAQSKESTFFLTQRPLEATIKLEDATLHHWQFSCKMAEHFAYGATEVFFKLPDSVSRQAFGALKDVSSKDYLGVMQQFFDRPSHEAPSFLPFRLYVSKSMSCITLPVKPTLEDAGRATTLGEYITAVAPSEAAKLNTKLIALIHGIRVPLSTPCLWLMVNMCHADMFVHVVLRHI
ncbi:hypothetical protein H696_01965 [Fonticula alba]|uniref:Autophagy protein 5 n=1 Tax=Fonticula alba TaxID=691883 RepID=A0A058Z9P9_FONAL|nr:hypothetical protein H696_01965 [Fonticula alba]KCV71019.1 hypothetical protein H696_01965 [Fonticula alba]|eukprot:XP_009494142.1 hypothetical protein H696_01965 [Fonticula alba]